jgi:hypothetical protein
MKYATPLAACIAIASQAYAEEAAPAVASITDMFKNGEAHLSFRLRYEDVDVDTSAAADEAQALTLKTRLNFKTAAFNGFTGFIEVDDLTAWDNDDYNDTVNGNTDKAVIADPEGTEVNQAWVAYNNWDTTFKWGRQRILLDNQRFVGGVGWRQNEQTYDAFSITNNSLENTTIFLANVTNVNRIFGEDSSAGDHDHDTLLANIKYVSSLGTLSAYYYDIDNDDAAGLSNETYGLRWVGKAGDKVGYTLEWATQDEGEGSGSATDYDADYLHVGISANVAPVTLALDYELLESDDGVKAFQTPLATLHAFQGWTDQFLGTPAQGIEDVYFTAKGKVAGVALSFVYHEYTADEDNGAGDDDLGDEWGFVAAKKFGAYSVALKYSDYSAGDDSFNKVDVDKLWITFTANF